MVFDRNLLRPNVKIKTLVVLGFHYHIPAMAKDGKFLTSGFLGVFLDTLALQVDELVCFMHEPLPAEQFMMDYQMTAKNLRLISLGPHNSVPKRLLMARAIIKKVKGELLSLDVLLMRGPTPLLPAFAKVKNLKKAYLIVGDYVKSSKDLKLPFLRKKFVQLWARINKIQQEAALNDALVFVNNALIFQELNGKVRNIHLVKTTTLGPDDFFFREDTCQGKTINLLYTGRLDPSKGLFEMVHALRNVRDKGFDIHLHFVGWEDKNLDVVKRQLIELASALFVSGHVTFHGKKNVGSELNFYYRMADIFLIGSKVNEGFPRTIWEAFANSLPVVASAVPSIPLFLEDEEDAILTKPGDSLAMASAVVTLIENGPLRRKIIRNAHEKAKEVTLDKQCGKLVRVLQDAFASSDHLALSR